ncbi:Tripartite tricarboxylate transporter family receptor [compost metagenome]|uniref:Bug family tripartite tricarboxylate transporter substrate binding protein n=1 Tax=Polaromonas aquatica TaxID=332657 RepID=A0ABW1TVT7_9BURK
MRVLKALIPVIALAGVFFADYASAQSFPSKPVKIIVPFTAGGLADALARGIAQELGREWPQPVVVENKPGANTIIAAEATAKAPADGYTLLMANDPTLSSNQYLYSKLPYDPVKDFIPVINVAETLQLLVAGPAFSGKTLADVIAVAKAKPGEVSYGTYGAGSKAHIDTEAFARQAGIKLLHVPYKGVADVVPALLGSQIQIAIAGVPPVLPLVQSGQLRAIAIASPKRSAVLPNVPTFTEAGLKDFNASAWFGLVAPAGTPRAIVEKIAADVSKIIVRPEFQKKYISGVGLELLNQGPGQFAEFLQKDRAAYAVHIKNINVKLD